MDQNPDQQYQNRHNSNNGLYILIFLLVALFFSLLLVFRTTVFFGKATSSNSSPIVLENSYLFASPLQALADNQEQIRITAFLLDGRGLGVGNQKVDLIYPQSLQMNPVQPYTDETGKAVFDLHTPTTGTYFIEASVNNKKIPQKIKLIFY
ncbi:hypothetical protein KBC75_01625 [Candidatus Shapirobacteria bacterium]|nr:hypothetical protein [Candidatus Shapirobacteria bacterium]